VPMVRDASPLPNWPATAVIYESHVRGDLIIETLDAPPPSTPIAAPPTTRHRGRVVLAPRRRVRAIRTTTIRQWF
jgi:hypothetical protein